MTEFLTILMEIILPVFILIGLGALLHRKFQLNLYTLAKLNIYFLVPGLIFDKLYKTHFSMDVFTKVILFFICYIALLVLVSNLVSRIFRFSKGMKIAFSNTVMFYNSGNYGVPVNDLVFKQDPFAMSIQVLVLAFQNMLTFSYGIFSIRAVQGGKLKAALGYFRMPVLYAMLAGIGFNVLNIKPPSFLLVPVTYISQSLVAIALLTLGAQVANLKIRRIPYPVFISLGFRLILGPFLALCVIWLFQLDGVVAQALLISSAMPTSVNSAIIAQEYNNEPEFAAQVVWLSTLLSAVTVTFVIYFARAYFHIA